MEHGLTVGFLRARIWVATLVILVSLAASSAVLAVALRAQEAKSQFTLAFNRIAESVTRVEHELAVITAGGKVSPVALSRHGRDPPAVEHRRSRCTAPSWWAPTGPPQPAPP